MHVLPGPRLEPWHSVPLRPSGAVMLSALPPALRTPEAGKALILSFLADFCKEHIIIRKSQPGGPILFCADGSKTCQNRCSKHGGFAAWLSQDCHAPVSWWIGTGALVQHKGDQLVMRGLLIDYWSVHGHGIVMDCVWNGQKTSHKIWGDHAGLLQGLPFFLPAWINRDSIRLPCDLYLVCKMWNRPSMKCDCTSPKPLGRICLGHGSKWMINPETQSFLSVWFVRVASRRESPHPKIKQRGKSGPTWRRKAFFFAFFFWGSWLLVAPGGS